LVFAQPLAFLKNVNSFNLRKHAAPTITTGKNIIRKWKKADLIALSVDSRVSTKLRSFEGFKTLKQRFEGLSRRLKWIQTI
jgi:hypothetical protein